MSGAPKTVTAEEQEDAVFSWVSCQEVEVLESIYQVLKVQIPTDCVGKKRSLRTNLLKHIEDELEDAEAKNEVSPVLLLLSDFIAKLENALKAGDQDTEDGSTPEVTTLKAEDSSAVLDVASKVLETAMLKNVKLEEEIAAMHDKIEKQKRMSSTGKVDVLKLKELKFTGVIGSGEKDSLSFTSLNYQIENAKTAGYESAQICAAVVKCISPSNYLRQFFESRPSLDLDVLLGVLKSQFREGDSGSVFSELCTLVQEPGDDANKYVLKLLCLKQKVLDLAVEEKSTSFTEEMVRTQLFRTMYSGLRNNNIRVELREKCGGLKVETMSDEDLLAMVMEVTINETTRNQMLGHNKKAAAGVNVVQCEDGSGEQQTSKGKKEKENPFVKIEELKVSNERQIAALTALVQALQVQVEEIRNAVIHNNPLTPPNNIPIMQSNYPPFRPAAPTMPTPPRGPPANLLGGGGVCQGVKQHQLQILQQQQQQQQQQQNQHGASRPPAPQKTITKCKSCKQGNLAKCTHCYLCGEGTHRILACPKLNC